MNKDGSIKIFAKVLIFRLNSNTQVSSKIIMIG